MELVLLGTAGGPRPSRNRASPAQAVVQDGLVYVVDCGSGVVGQMTKAGLRPQDTAAIFITHHHADHMLDMGALPLTAWTDGLNHSVELFGPPPTTRSFASFLDMMAAELTARTSTTGRANFADLVQVTELTEPAVVLQRGDLTVRAALVDHPPFDVALAYRFDSPAGSIVISGDTCYSPALIDLAQGADLLVHEAIYESALQLQLAGAGAKTLLEHLVGSHTTAENAGRVAREAGVRTLILSHLVPHHDGVTDEMWRAAAATEFSGRIVVGWDLMRFHI